MGVKFFGSKDNPRWVYTPEKVNEENVGWLRNLGKESKEVNGYVGPKRELRLEARIPQAVEYNWCMNRGIPGYLHADYMKKNYKKLLEEFPVFKMVNTL